MENVLVNRVASSGLVTLNLEDYFPKQSLKVFDLKDYLFQGLILREKDFRAALKEHNWLQYKESVLLVYCSTDAIIPLWAYMLVASHAKGFADDVFVGNEEAYLTEHYRKAASELNIEAYTDAKLVIKGCSDKPVPPGAYAVFSSKLQEVAASIMFGEPCSTVPVYKKPRPTILS